MKSLCALNLLLLAVASNAQAAMHLVSAEQAHQVFSGRRTVSVAFQNSGNEMAGIDLSFRLMQTTSATAALISESTWKLLKVLPGQTVLESVTVDFPEVRAETQFAIQWLEDTNRVLGITRVMVYPTNLLQQLRALTGEDGVLGVFDPAQELKPLLSVAGVEVQDLEEAGVEGFRGRLAVFGPFGSKAHVPGDLARRIQGMSAKGVAAVWILPPHGPHEALKPSFEVIPVGAGTVVLIEHDLVDAIGASPQAQLNLIQCCRLALHPVPTQLPCLDE